MADGVSLCTQIDGVTGMKEIKNEFELEAHGSGGAGLFDAPIEGRPKDVLSKRSYAQAAHI